MVGAEAYSQCLAEQEVDHENGIMNVSCMGGGGGGGQSTCVF